MSEDESETKPGIEFDYHLGKEGNMQTAVVVRDPARIRQVVMMQFQWIPSVMPESKEDYPGFEALETAVEAGDSVDLPVMVLGHMPSHLKPEEAVDDIQHMLLLIDPEQLITAIGSGINMFARDSELTEKIMGLIAHVIGHEHPDDDDDQG